MSDPRKYLLTYYSTIRCDYCLEIVTAYDVKDAIEQSNLMVANYGQYPIGTHNGKSIYENYYKLIRVEPCTAPLKIAPGTRLTYNELNYFLNECPLT